MDSVLILAINLYIVSIIVLINNKLTRLSEDCSRKNTDLFSHINFYIKTLNERIDKLEDEKCTIKEEQCNLCKGSGFIRASKNTVFTCVRCRGFGKILNNGHPNPPALRSNEFEKIKNLRKTYKSKL